jgi:Helix-turn-helix domain
VENGIGPTLREARNRRKIDLSEVEASTKIRARYLRALENEEWDVLPGGAYTRSFLRTYASFLGLDGQRLADQYGRSLEPSPGERDDRRPAPVAPARGRGGATSFPRGAWIALAALGLLSALLVIGLLGGGSGSSVGPAPLAKHGKKPEHHAGSKARVEPRSVSVRLAATAAVWVCLLDENGRALVDGQVLSVGAQEGPFHSGSFTVSFGNGEVSMMIDGQEASIPATSSPIGYSIDSGGNLQPLPDSQRPTCT